MSCTEVIGSSHEIRSRWSLEQLDGLVGQRRILDQRVGQPLDDAAVERRVRVDGHRRVAVQALHVDDVDAVERRQLRDERVVPARGRVELEPQTRIDGAHGAQRGDAGGLAEADRHDEPHGLRFAFDGLVQREPVLPQRQVEGRALEGPPAVEPGAGADRLDREEVGQPHQRGELVEGAPAAQPRQRTRAAELLDLVDLVPGDVLALADVAVAGQPDHRRDLGEPAGGVAGQRQELAALDAERQIGDARVCRAAGHAASVPVADRPLSRARGSIVSSRGDEPCAAPDRRHRWLHGVHAGRTARILGHAEAATSRLLEKVVDAARGFDLIEIEGDAAFLSRDADELDDGGGARPDHRGRRRRCTGPSTRNGSWSSCNLCPCDSCAQTSGLKLKFVAHVGEVATQKIRRQRKLVGVDVIYVHRLLKNPVQVPEYVLFSEALYGDRRRLALRRPRTSDRAGPRGHRLRAGLLSSTSKTSPAPASRCRTRRWRNGRGTSVVDVQHPRPARLSPAH